MIVTVSGQPRFLVLGGLRARIDGREIDLGARQPRLIIALLLARGGDPAPVTEIAGLLWPGSPPPTATNVVHRHIGAIRRALEPALPPRAEGRWLHRTPGGYRLTLPIGASDLSGFRKLVAAASLTPTTPLPSAAPPATAASPLPAPNLSASRAGLALWTGRFAEGLGADEHPLVVAVNQERTAAALAASAMTLTDGRPDDAEALLPLLAAAVDADPLNESLVAHLMLVLSAAGRPAEAINRFHSYRSHLNAELDVTPGPELQAALAQILRGPRPSVTVSALPSSSPLSPPPSPLLPPPSSPLPPSRSPLLPPSSPSLHPSRPVSSRPYPVLSSSPPGRLAPIPAQLPSPSAHFIGRLAERAELSRALDVGTTVIALDGLPGIGKTALAVQWAHEVADRFPDGQLFVDLRNSTADSFMATLLGSVGVGGPATSGDINAYFVLWNARMAGRRMLILLDDAHDSAQVRPLLPPTPGSLVLVTSRGRLSGLRQASHLADAHLLTVEVPSAEDAAGQLLNRLGVPAPRDRAEREALATVLDRTGRLPLALAIVTARLPGGLPNRLRALADLLRLEPGLDAFCDDDPASDLRAVLDRSYRRLSLEAARQLRELSRGPAEIDQSAVSVELAGSGLLTRHGSRFTLHELIRAYAREMPL